MSSIPQLRAIYNEADEASTELEAFVGECERQLSENLRSSTLPDPQLVHAIAVAKVRAVETSIALCFKLKQEVGSFALMAESGFKHMDFLRRRRRHRHASARKHATNLAITGKQSIPSISVRGHSTVATDASFRRAFLGPRVSDSALPHNTMTRRYHTNTMTHH